MMSLIGLIAILTFLAILAGMLITAPFKLSRVKKSVFFLGVLLVSGVFYYFWGGGALWHEYSQQQYKNKQARALLATIKNPDELITTLKKTLGNTAKSAEGWFLLGRLYSAQGNWSSACEAFALANQFAPNNQKTMSNYAYALWQNNGHKFTTTSRKLYHQLLQLNSEQPDALAMLAMDSYQQHQFNQAQQYWRRLLPLVNNNSEEEHKLRNAILEAEKRK